MLEAFRTLKHTSVYSGAARPISQKTDRGKQYQFDDSRSQAEAQERGGDFQYLVINSH